MNGAKAVADMIRKFRLNVVTKLTTYGARVVAFYYGYQILHHEVYEAVTAEPLLVFLGLWLCGIAPATFFDQARRFTASVQAEMSKADELNEAAKLPDPMATPTPPKEASDDATK